jgi:ribonuclease H / adenosylcobalamin/alpha-ribazole phosphatase
MPLFYLVRHGSNDYLSKGLAGRLPGVCLNEKGRAEAAWVADVLLRAGIQRIISSPLERCHQTAEPLAKSLNLAVETSAEILEIDFGDWTGKTMAELKTSDHWARFNTYRSGTRPPNGESMIEVQARMIAFLEKLARQSPDQTIAIFSHGDPIRSVLTYYLGMPLDFLIRLEVSPGSYSVLRLEPWGAEILAINRLP